MDYHCWPKALLLHMPNLQLSKAYINILQPTLCPITEDFKDELYVMLIITLLLMAYFLSYSKLTGTNN